MWLQCAWPIDTLLIYSSLIKVFMKKTILWFFTAILCAFAYQASSQCTVSNIIIQHVSVAGSQSPGTCTVTFDASFNLEHNNGNKYVFIHSWIQQQYPNYFHCVNGQPTGNGAIHAPKHTDLANAFLNIGINNNVTPPALLSTYTPDPSVPLSHVDSISVTPATNGTDVFILYGVTVTLPISCGTPVVIMTDLWSSQSAAAQVAHCVNCGIAYSAGYLNANGFVNCASLAYNATLTNNTSTAMTGFYRLYADVNSDGYFTPAIDTLIVDTTAFSIAAGPGTTTSISGTVPAANRNQDMFLVLTQTSGQASGASRVVTLVSTQCSPLPVTLKTFSAERVNRTAVALRWETATEINNSGFSVQRNLGNNNWTIVSFIPSQAAGGNSSSALTYNFTDANNFNGVSQYRLKQVDIDGHAKFSEIRAVRGDKQYSGMIIYPNPSTNGQVTVVFDNANGPRDVTLVDMTGRVTRQWKGITGNTLQIETLNAGVYSLRVVNKETGAQSVEKISISR
jgi:hypothetical protein